VLALLKQALLASARSVRTRALRQDAAKERSIITAQNCPCAIPTRRRSVMLVYNAKMAGHIEIRTRAARERFRSRFHRRGVIGVYSKFNPRGRSSRKIDNCSASRQAISDNIRCSTARRIGRSWCRPGVRGLVVAGAGVKRLVGIVILAPSPAEHWRNYFHVTTRIGFATRAPGVVSKLS